MGICLALIARVALAFGADDMSGDSVHQVWQRAAAVSATELALVMFIAGLSVQNETQCRRKRDVLFSTLNKKNLLVLGTPGLSVDHHAPHSLNVCMRTCGSQRVPFLTLLARARARAHYLARPLCTLCGDTVALAVRLLGDADWSETSTVEPDTEDNSLENTCRMMLTRNAKIKEQKASSVAQWTICTCTHPQKYSLVGLMQSITLKLLRLV